MSKKEVKLPTSLDETYKPSDEPRMSSYDRLQSIFAEKDAQEGKLTPEGAEKLDYLLGIENKPSKLMEIWTKIKSFFTMIDSKIFAKRSRMWNTTYSPRKRK
jgi:hypothetical protein